MALEGGTVITDLQPTYPQDNELIKDGAAHLRLIKAVLTNTLKGFKTIVTMTSDKLNLFDANFDMSATATTVKTALVATANPSASTANNWDLKGNDMLNVGSSSYTSGDPANDRRAASIADVVKYSKTTAWPIGSIFLTIDTKNPADTFGGTWQQVGQGRCISGVGAYGGATITAGGSGGTATKTLATANLPAHNHGASGLSGTATSAGGHAHRFLGDDGVGAFNTRVQNWNYDAKSHGGDGGIYNTTTDGAHTHPVTMAGATASTGSGSAFDVMQPWFGVYVWQRTA